MPHARGHGRARAPRSVADRLLNVACAMPRDGTVFDATYAGPRTSALRSPARRGRNPRRRGVIRPSAIFAYNLVRLARFRPQPT